MKKIIIHLDVNSLYSHTQALEKIMSILNEHARFSLSVEWGYANDEDESDKVWRLIDEDKYDEAQKQLDRLRITHDDNPELVRIDTVIYMMTNGFRE